MSKKQYGNLIAQLYKTFGYKAEKQETDTCHVSVNDVAFSLVHMEDADENLYIYADFGPETGEKNIQVMSQFLLTNFFLSSHDSLGFGLHPLTGHILLMHRILISKLSVEGLLQTLKNMSLQIKVQQEAIRIATLKGRQDIFNKLSA